MYQDHAAAEPPARLFALVPCAGLGLRAGAGGPKQYAAVAGLPMVVRTLQSLRQVGRLQAILVVLAPGDDQFARYAPDFQGASAWVAHCGGPTRAGTVAAGLAALRARGARPQDWVLVHDAARCLIRPGWIDRLIDGCLDDPVGGLLALPLADTLKGEGTDAMAGRAVKTIERARKWAAQTPQMFRLGLLEDALNAAFAAADGAVGITDEASAIERLGHSVKLVPGELENFKLTWPGDFALAERLLSQPGLPL
jgi:2-C-methyl-D-erythritol 4-phosphate cytidylyltransferase